jgi:hypothetical protein
MTEVESPPSNPSPQVATPVVDKIVVVLLPADSLPLLKNNKFNVGVNQDACFVQKFLKDKLKSIVSGDQSVVLHYFLVGNTNHFAYSLELIYQSTISALS